MKALWLLFSLLVLCSLSQAAQIIRYVDPDAVGGGTGVDWANAYTSLNTCMTTEAQDLTDGGGDYFTCYCRSLSGTDDTTLCSITGAWVTNATCYIEVIGTDFPSDGVFDDTKYLLYNNDSGTATLTINEDYVRIHNIQILVKQTGANYRYGVYIASVGATTDIRIDSCIIKGNCSGTSSGRGRGIYIYDTTATVSTYNTIVQDFISGTNTAYYGIFNYDAANSYIYNCTVYNCWIGIYRLNPTVTVTNCAVGNTSDDFSGVMTINNCCSDDGDGNNPQGPLAGNWANEFVNPGTDFDLLAGGNCVGNGTDNPGAGLYSDDIIGTARTSVWDIGAFEYTAPPAGGGAQVIFISFD